jgi:hypothetical protein
MGFFFVFWDMTFLGTISAHGRDLENLSSRVNVNTATSLPGDPLSVEGVSLN